jgi:glyoxylase-like metal-dependent hydrolase (beta-lactamase superfamily II)
MKTPDIITRGKDNGEGMVIRYETAKGTNVFGLGMPNIYATADWDLGPTWCYLILGQKSTLIDTGHFGNSEFLKTILSSLGKGVSDIDRIIITHSHDDHDGNLAELLPLTRAELWAHSIYRQMIAYHPHITDGASHPEFPGSCRLCNMPEEFYKSNCLPYHQKRSALGIDSVIEDNRVVAEDDLRFIFTPGHSPDSICILLEDEVIFTGDTILPDITPHPSLAYTFQVNRRILPEGYRGENTVYGLMVYIKSLEKIATLPSQPIKATFPAHRLFYSGQFNVIDSSSNRAMEIIRFHIDRCSDILRIIDKKPTGVKDIAIQHFVPELLIGMGELMAQHEIMAHIEVMKQSGDVCWVGENEDLVQRTGSNNFLDVIGQYLH